MVVSASRSTSRGEQPGRGLEVACAGWVARLAPPPTRSDDRAPARTTRPENNRRIMNIGSLLPCKDAQHATLPTNDPMSQARIVARTPLPVLLFFVIDCSRACFKKAKPLV